MGSGLTESGRRDLREAIEIAIKAAEEGRDVFQTGSNLYEMVVGMRPEFSAGGQTRPIRTLRADVPQELIRIIRKALGENPDDRYANPAELSGELRELLRNFESAPLAVAALPQRRWIGPAIVIAILLIAAVVITLAVRDADARAAAAATSPQR